MVKNILFTLPTRWPWQKIAIISSPQLQKKQLFNIQNNDFRMWTKMQFQTLLQNYKFLFFLLDQKDIRNPHWESIHYWLRYKHMLIYLPRKFKTLNPRPEIDLHSPLALLRGVSISLLSNSQQSIGISTCSETSPKNYREKVTEQDSNIQK